MKINKDGSLTITLTPEQVEALKESLSDSKSTKKLPDNFRSDESNDVNLEKLRGFNGISDSFFEVRCGGEYDEQGIYLGSSALDDKRWKIVVDREGAQILIPE